MERLLGDAGVIMPLPTSGRGTPSRDRRRRLAGSVVVHSACGGQFRSRAFRVVLVRADVTGSMGRVASAGDNAAVESFVAQLQKNVLTIAAGGPAASSATRSSTESSTPTTVGLPTWTRQTHPRRVRTRIRTRPDPRRPGGLITHDHEPKSRPTRPECAWSSICASALYLLRPPLMHAIVTSGDVGTAAGRSGPSVSSFVYSQIPSVRTSRSPATQ